MSYYISTTFNGTFDDAIAKVTEELKKEGFGVLTEIDVKETLKNIATQVHDKLLKMIKNM